MMTASLKLYLVGTGWMSQTISLIQTIDLVRPFASGAEARDAVHSIRRELLATATITKIDGLTHRDHHYGDFSAIIDVRMTYSVTSQGEAMGLFGASRTTTVSESEALEFSDPDSEFALVFGDEEEG